jgi:hypothetical protein
MKKKGYDYTTAGLDETFHQGKAPTQDQLNTRDALKGFSPSGGYVFIGLDELGRPETQSNLRPEEAIAALLIALKGLTEMYK